MLCADVLKRRTIRSGHAEFFWLTFYENMFAKPFRVKSNTAIKGSDRWVTAAHIFSWRLLLLHIHIYYMWWRTLNIFFKLSKYQTLSSSYNWNKSKRSSSSLQLTVKLLVSEWIDLNSGDISVFPYIFVFELKAHY